MYVAHVWNAFEDEVDQNTANVVMHDLLAWSFACLKDVCPITPFRPNIMLPWRKLIEIRLVLNLCPSHTEIFSKRRKIYSWMSKRLDKSFLLTLLNFWRWTNPESGWKKINVSHSNANGHITLNTPVLVRSLKLSNVESSQYLDGWPPGNTGCCWLLFFVLFYSFLSTLLIHFWSIFDPFSPASTTCLKSQNVKKRFPCLTREGVGSQSCFQTLTFEENL